METKLVSLDRENIDMTVMEEAAELLRAGELVAFPTETVYGLGGDGLDAAAAQRIYAAKGRPSDNPLIVHIADTDAFSVLAREVPEEAYLLAKRFWPGPLTMILKKSGRVPAATTGGLETVAIRMPSDEIALSLIRTSGIFIAAPSANASGRPSPTKAEHVYEDLQGKIPMILDGGAVTIGLESTIVDLSGEVPLILRPGYITPEMLREILPNVAYDPAILKKTADPTLVAKAPGMKYRHYAPKGNLRIYEGSLDAVVAKIREEAAKKVAEGYSVAILASEETKGYYPEFVVRSVGTRAQEETVAANLFDTLREFDHMGARFIFGECFSREGIGHAIMNRLLKAAGYQMETV